MVCKIRFHDRDDEFVDICYSLKRAVLQAGAGAGSILGNIVRPVWSNDDFLAPLFAVLLGQYPEADEITINYAKGMRSALELPDKAITKDDGFSSYFLNSVTPLALTGFDLSQSRDRSGWLSPEDNLRQRNRFWSPPPSICGQRARLSALRRGGAPVETVVRHFP